MAALHQKDSELAEILRGLGDLGAARFELDFFGSRRSFGRYGAIMLQHEPIHHGEWSL